MPTSHLRVLQIGNPANVGVRLRDALRETRIADSLVLEIQNNLLNYPEDIRFSWDWGTTRKGIVLRMGSYLMLLESLILESDIVHIHVSGGLIPPLEKWIRAHGKPTIRHFHGDELRRGIVTEEATRADAIVLATPDLQQRLTRIGKMRMVRWIPNPYPLPTLPLHRGHPSGDKGIRVVHAYLRDAKYADTYGTDTIRRAVKRLRETGANVVLDEVTNVNHQEALRRFASGDIAVDKLRIGWYGMFSIECIGLGVPVLAGIAPELMNLDPPPLAVTEEGLYDTLRALVQNPERLGNMAEEQLGRARDLHSPGRVAAQMLEVYNQVSGK